MSVTNPVLPWALPVPAYSKWDLLRWESLLLSRPYSGSAWSYMAGPEGPRHSVLVSMAKKVELRTGPGHNGWQQRGPTGGAPGCANSLL